MIQLARVIYSHGHMESFATHPIKKNVRSYQVSESEDGPIPALHGVVRWRLIDLAQWLFEEFRASISKPTLSRELRHMGFRKLSARPRHHAQRGSRGGF